MVGGHGYRKASDDQVHHAKEMGTAISNADRASGNTLSY